jgi:hypothetical protein
MIEGISAITLATHAMASAVSSTAHWDSIYFMVASPLPLQAFVLATAISNLIAQPQDKHWSWWGRIIFYVDDVDALYHRAIAAGYQPSTVPRDAEWGERYFHLTDLDGHELSFARPLRSAG